MYKYLQKPYFTYIPVIALFYLCSVTNYNLVLKRNPIHISMFHFLIQYMNISDTPFPQNTAALQNVNHPDTQKNITTYITISNDVLNFYHIKHIKAYHFSLPYSFLLNGFSLEYATAAVLNSSELILSNRSRCHFV